MATFLKNSDDIILDAVLTDVGRQAATRNNEADQKITQFALFDDEIDYSIYRSKWHPAGAHPSGSAHYDLDILQRPVLQAFTRGFAKPRSHLVTLEGAPDFLPVLKLNFNREDYGGHNSAPTWGNVEGEGFKKESFLVLIDESTISKLNGEDKDAGVVNSYKVIGPTAKRNYLDGVHPQSGGIICVEQGIDSGGTTDTLIKPMFVEEFLGGDYPLYEYEYFIEFDMQYCWPTDIAGTAITRGALTRGNATLNRLIADASVRQTDCMGAGAFLESETLTEISPDELFPVETVIKGPRSTRLQFKLSIQPDSNSLAIQNNIKLFDELGVELTSEVSKTMFGEDVTFATAAENSFFYTYIKVFGASSGYEVSIPLRFLKRYDFKYLG